MTGIESVLPHDETLEGAIAEPVLNDLVHDELAERQANSLFRDVIDWTIVSGMDLSLSDALASMIGYQSEQEKESLVRGMLFARQVISMVYGNSQGVRFPDYCQFQPGMVAEQRKRITEDTQLYLGARPNLDAFVKTYMPDIDEGRTFPHSAETASALVFMSGEALRAEKYMEQCLDDMNPNDFSE